MLISLCFPIGPTLQSFVLQPLAMSLSRLVFSVSGIYSGPAGKFIPHVEERKLGAVDPVALRPEHAIETVARRPRRIVFAA